MRTSNLLNNQPQLGNLTSFQELITTEKDTVFGLNSSYGLSALRDIATITGGATIDETGGEIRLLTTTGGTDDAILETVQTGVYVPGKAAEYGIGVRIPALPTGNQSATWGLANAENGYQWGVNATGYFITVRRNSSDTTITQANWNLDRLDGTGKSGINLASLTNAGIIWQCDFVWYGYGSIVFKVTIATPRGNQSIPVHYYSPPAGANSIIDPNLPIRVRVSNGGTTSAFSLFTGGRQYSIYGDYVPQSKPVSAFRVDTNTSDGLWFPLIVWRKKSTFRGRINTVNCAPRSFTASSSNRPHILGLFLENTGVVTTGTFAQPLHTPTNESALEVNISATASYTPSANAVLIATDGIEKSVGSSNDFLQELDRQNFSLPPNKHLIFAARPVGGNGTVEVCSMNMRELR